MNKKSTLLVVLLMIVGSFAAKAEGAIVLGASNDFYYLKAGDDAYLTLGGFKDSVVVKAIDETKSTKAVLDSALWQIVDKQTSLGVTTYSIRNKATSQYLAFAPGETSVPKLVPVKDGVSHRWIFNEGTDLKSYYSNDKYLALTVTGSDDNKELSLIKDASGSEFSIKVPAEKFALTADQLGAGFRTFKLKFADTYEGNIFADTDLIAKNVEGKAGYVTLQAKGDESYPNGVAKYLGVDTLKTKINGAQNAFGYKFSSDSIRTTLKPNEAWKQFKFTIDLKNDSLAMFVAGTPFSNTDTAQVVVASVDTKRVLTVSAVSSEGEFQGAAPSVTLAQGTHATIPTGAGVYFLKSASKRPNGNGGKYYVADDAFMGGDSVPSINLARGQWLIHTEGGKYSVVDRESNTALILNQEIFEVQGMKDTYLFGDDSVTVIQQPVDLKNKYLGSLAFSQQELVDNGFYLTLIPGTSGVNSLYVYTTDSILMGGPNEVKNASIFKLIAADTSVVAGAKQLGDVISVISYKLRGLFNMDTIAVQTDSLKFSKKDAALTFRFISDETAQKYAMMTEVKGKGNLYVGMDINTSCVQLTKNVAYVNLLRTEAPEYASFENGHKRLSFNNNSLVMNPYTLLGESMIEGNDIVTKASYVKDNFSLWVEQAEELVDGKQLYFISFAKPKTKAADDSRLYLAAKDTLGGRAVFMYNETIKTAKDSPALFAFKTAEDGGFYLENQSELSKQGGKPYVGMLNGFAVMQETPSAAFEVESVSAPVANETITEPTAVRLVGSVGEFSILNAGGKKITISNILGQTIGTRYVSSDNVTIPTTRGVLIVSVEGDKAYKVIVK